MGTLYIITHIFIGCVRVLERGTYWQKFLRAVLESWCSLKGLNWISSSNFVSRSGFTTHEEEEL